MEVENNTNKHCFPTYSDYATPIKVAEFLPITSENKMVFYRLLPLSGSPTKLLKLEFFFMLDNRDDFSNS